MWFRKKTEPVVASEPEPVYERLAIPEEHAIEVCELFDALKVAIETRAYRAAKLRLWKRVHELVPHVKEFAAEIDFIGGLWPAVKIRVPVDPQPNPRETE